MPVKPRAAVVIGRFQPFHNAHKQLIDFALEQAESVVICLGSCYQPRTMKNPWTFHERMDMIRRVYLHTREKDWDRITVVPLRDHHYSNHLWVAEVQNRVGQAIEQWIAKDPETRESVFGKVKREEIVLVGHQKDDSSFYLSIFGWRALDPGKFKDINATDLREQFLENGGNMSDDLPIQVRELMGLLRTTPAYQRLTEEYQFLKQYREQWKSTPFPVQFVTVDAVVTQAGHVLLVKRKGAPGEGLWALPGGFVNPKEKIEEAVIRELREETCAHIAPEALVPTAQRVYDHPDRDLRGRIITHAFLFRLPEKDHLPRVQGGDDAAEAQWFSLGDFLGMEQEIYSDHFHIINDLLQKE